MNLAAAEGHPAAVMDMSFANQALSAEWIVKHAGDLEPRGLSGAARDRRARSRASSCTSMGVEIDALTAEQEEYLRSWEQGT